MIRNAETANEEKARKLSLLIMLLLALHVLFGITGVMAVLIAHIKRSATDRTIYLSHLDWQIVTFWVALTGYCVAIWAWTSLHVLWPALFVAAFVAYRLCVNLYYWVNRQPISRII